MNLKPLTSREKRMLDYIKLCLSNIPVPDHLIETVNGEYWKAGARAVLKRYNDAIMSYDPKNKL